MPSVLSRLHNAPPALCRIAAARTLSSPSPRFRDAPSRSAESRSFKSIDITTENGLSRGDPAARRARGNRRCPDSSRRPDAQGQRADRRHRHLPPGGAAVHRQADRAGEELRRPGRHRHREHAAAQRAARIRSSSRPPPPTCSRSSAVRPSICRPVLDTLVESAAQSVRGRYGRAIIPTRRRRSSDWQRSYGILAEVHANILQAHPDVARIGAASVGRAASRRQSVHIPDVLADPGIYVASKRQKLGRLPDDRSACHCLREGNVDRRDLLIAQNGATALHRQADRAGRRPSPTRR